MRRFTTRLLLAFVGVTFIGFFTVYILFNIFMNNHIRTEAKRDLANGIVSIIDSNALVVSGMQIDTDDLPIPAISIRRSMLYVEFIIIDEQDNVLSPFVPLLTYEQQVEVASLADFYTDNRQFFENSEMVRLDSDTGTFYLKSINADLFGLSVSYLMYANVTSAMDFMATMNRVLIVLLAVLGVIYAVISVSMSAIFKKAISRLCNYAEKIGSGKFHENAESSYYVEFEQLSSSMDKMAKMLNIYESSQKQFFQNVTHELKAPLMSIIGYAEGILGNVFNDDKAAQVILKEGEKMLELVNGLLYISRMDSGLNIAEDVYPINIKNLIYDCCERLKTIAEKQSKQIVVEPTDKEISVMADDDKLETAVINILTNAIRYAMSEIIIDYDVVGDCLEIHIQDDGQGINPTDLPFIFDRFYKGEKGILGLGLAISKDIIENMGGSIKAENLTHPQSGARFTVTLPIDKK
jgi:signal transduction histidine kinase